MGKKDDKPKRKAPDPIPLVGVRGSSTKVSLVKGAAVVGATSVALIAPRGRQLSASQHLTDSNLGAGSALQVATERAGELWKKYGTRILIGGGLVALFGKAFDRRYRDFPVRLGR